MIRREKRYRQWGKFSCYIAPHIALYQSVSQRVIVFLIRGSCVRIAPGACPFFSLFQVQIIPDSGSRDHSLRSSSEETALLSQTAQPIC